MTERGNDRRIAEAETRDGQRPGPPPVPAKVRRLLDELLATENTTCFERARILTRSYRETEGQPQVVRRAKALHAGFSALP